MTTVLILVAQPLTLSISAALANVVRSVLILNRVGLVALPLPPIENGSDNRLDDCVEPAPHKSESVTPRDERLDIFIRIEARTRARHVGRADAELSAP